MSTHLYLATRKGLFHFTRGGSANAAPWRQQAIHFLGDNVTMLLPTPDGYLYAGLALGHFGAKLRRLAPGETEWHECAVPVYPEGAEMNAGPPTGDGNQAKKPAMLSEIWSLETGGLEEPGTLWAGTIPGGLFKSTDRGDSWQLVESLWNAPERSRWFGGGKDDPGIHSVAVDPRDSRSVSIAISCGGVWHTTDGGATWECRGQGLRAEYMPPELAGDPAIQDPHRMVRSPADPDTLWIQHHNGVFLSRDGARTWRELDSPRPAVFGFAVAAHPRDPQTAWIVPAVKDETRVPVEGRFVVSRTRDGGETFEILSRGLPQEPAYDIVFRHALDVDETGDRLAVGSTTGGLWTSDNGGDDWACISHTLPPIYCVRFGA